MGFLILLSFNMKNIFYITGCMLFFFSYQHRESLEDVSNNAEEYLLLENIVNAFTPESDILFWSMDFIGDLYIVEYANMCCK